MARRDLDCPISTFLVSALLMFDIHEKIPNRAALWAHADHRFENGTHIFLSVVFPPNANHIPLAKRVVVCDSGTPSVRALFAG
jgi:hypothetical protein